VGVRRSVLSALLVAGCAAGDSPELACQKRIVGAGSQPGADQADRADPFDSRRYAAVDRTGCTAQQLATLARIVALTKALPGLSEANERAGRSGDPDRHMIAFQAMNDALIELNDLVRGAGVDLDRLSVAPAR
jgi:hypothetical protein